MVISGDSEGEEPRKLKAMAPERSKPLHNFSMPCLKWGNQRHLRCMKINSNGEIFSFDHRSSASEAESEGLIIRQREWESEKRRSSSGSEGFKKSPLPPVGVSGRKSKIERDGDDGIEGVREKLMFDLRTATDKMKAAIVDEGEEEELSAAATRPWNLRRRRAACKSPNETNGRGGGLRNEERQQNSSPPRTGNPAMISLRPRGFAAAQGAEKKERCKFSISLSREEKEEDFRLMIGTRPSRRPKKRAKIVQKQLDRLFPGLWISEITPDSYEVPDFPEPGKK
ncbi:hypothetical protein HHK36_024635 [Tetracentron sinense]|uniref:Uncharacterized protein n=1 Tax=Tetracentron sinense TaxID=13715 RepID=A0A834YPF5_TETSI|nr:hypothetical protein HHK36_024635 [Tetracentron sinense]